MVDIYFPLSTLSARNQHRAFVLAIAERLFPAYEAWATASGLGEPAECRKTIDELWDATLSDIFPYKASILDSRLRRWTPSLRRIDGELVEFAVAFVNIVRRCIQFWATDDEAIIKGIVRAVYDAIDSKIEAGLEARLVLGPEDHSSHELHQRERQAQLDLAADLVSAPLTPQNVLAIKKVAREMSAWR